MGFDLNLFLTISGWLLGIVSLFVALKEHLDKNRVQKTLEQLKSSEFAENLKKSVAILFPAIRELGLDSAVSKTSEKYLLDYLKYTTLDDPNALLNVWEKAAISIGSSIEENVKRASTGLPGGLSECVAFMLITHYSPNRGREYLDSKTRVNKALENNLVRYYISLRNSPSTLTSFIEQFRACSADEVTLTAASLRGDEFKRIVDLFDSQKWNKRMVERMREFVHVRQMSYTSLATKMLETSPLPRLFILFKNEGVEGSEEVIGKGRVVQNILHDLKQQGKIELIAPLAPVYFIKDSQTVEFILSKLPEGEANNYLVFTGALDPLAVNIKTSDKLEGRPALLYENLIKFRNQREVYASILLKLGVKPSDVIEKADIGFLVEPKSDDLSDALRTNSPKLMKKLGDFAKRRLDLLTDLRNLDEDDLGYFGTILAEAAGLSQTEGHTLAEQISNESKELYKALYEPIE